MSTIKKSNSKSNNLAQSSPDASAIAATLGAQLRQWTGYTELINANLKDINQLQSDLDVDNKPINLVKNRLEKAYDQMSEQAKREIDTLDLVLESLDSWIDLTPSTSQDSSSFNPSTNKRGPYKKKLKGPDGAVGLSNPPSALGSPLGSGLASPAMGHNPSLNPSPLTPLAPLPPSLAAAPAIRATSVKPIAPLPSTRADSPQAPSSGGASSASLPARLTKQNRKALLTAQLPLTPGRQVAFRLPAKASEPKKEEWILARVVNSINGDKNRYAVEDVDYDPSNPTPEEGHYNTTFKSIVPLPDPRTAESRASTYPPHDYAPGTMVMGLYPETTSFYKAVIIGGPETLQEKGKKKEKVYRITFEDDENLVRNVSIDLVVELP